MENDARRAQLLTFGLELFSQRAYSDVSIGDIAESAGVSKGLLYHYFGNKRDFYVEVVRASCANLLVAIRSDLSVPPKERARAGIDAYLDFVEAHTRAYTGLISGGIGVDDRVAEVVEATRQASAMHMLEGIGLDTPRPVFRILARGWIGALETASIDWMENRDVPREQFIEMMLALVASVVSVGVGFDPDAELTLPAD